MSICGIQQALVVTKVGNIVFINLFPKITDVICIRLFLIIALLLYDTWHFVNSNFFFAKVVQSQLISVQFIFNVKIGMLRRKDTIGIYPT